MPIYDSDDSMDSADDTVIDNTLDVYLKKRKEEMREEFAKKQLVLEKSHGTLLDVDEAVFLDNIRQSEYVVCHFYHPEFATCSLLSALLEQLAREHAETKFIKINALDAGFFVNKLKIKTLPTLCVFKGGVLVKKFLGFEEFGMDAPDMRLLKQALGKAHAIHVSDEEVRARNKTIFGFEHAQVDEDSF